MNHGDEHEGFPWSYFLSLVTFSLVLLIDKVFFNQPHKHDHKEHSKDVENKKEESENKE